MKVLMIAPEPFFQPRGTPISVYQRLRALSDLGHTADLLTYHLGESVDIPNVSVCRIRNVSFIKAVKIGPSWVKLLLDLLLFCKAATMLIKNRYAVIHSHEEAVFFFIVLKYFLRTPLLYDMHSSLLRQIRESKFGKYPGIARIFGILEKAALRSCDALITIDGELEDYAKKSNSSVPTVMIENLPIQTLASPPEASLADALREKLNLNGKLPIVYTGNFEPYQGVEILLKSAKIVRNVNPGALFLFVGGTHEQIQWWKEEARRRNLMEHTLFVGSVPADEIRQYLSVAEILVSPRTKGTSVPLKVYTYLYSGKPIVATDVPAHTMVLSDANAVLVAPTGEAIAEGILQLLRDPPLRKRLGEQAQAFAKERFDPAVYRGKVEQAYRFCQTSQISSDRPTRASAGA